MLQGKDEEENPVESEGFVHSDRVDAKKARRVDGEQAEVSVRVRVPCTAPADRSRHSLLDGLLVESTIESLWCLQGLQC